MEQSEYGDFPLRRFLGMDVGDMEPGRAVASVDITDKLLNPNGVVHGAVLFTMVDTAMGMATMSLLDEGQVCASVEVQMRFLRPASGQRLRAEASVTQPGRKIVHLEARVTNQDGELVATGAGTFAVISAKRFC